MIKQLIDPVRLDPASLTRSQRPPKSRAKPRPDGGDLDAAEVLLLDDPEGRAAGQGGLAGGLCRKISAAAASAVVSVCWWRRHGRVQDDWRRLYG